MKFREWSLDALFYIAGSVLVSVAVNSFALPNNIVTGGVTGIATIFHDFFEIPVGTAVIVMNIPILLLGAKNFGFRFMYKTIIATLLVSLFIDLGVLLPAYTGDRILSALFGGVVYGAGLALVFLRGATTGGIDIIAKIVTARSSRFSIGVMMLLIDAFVVTLSGVVYASLETALYALILIFVQTKIIDRMVYGADTGKLLLVNSREYKAIADSIISELHRGVTLLNASGAYSGAQRRVVMCAVRRYETAALLKLVRQIDPTAFIITLDAGEIKGEGFTLPVGEQEAKRK